MRKTLKPLDNLNWKILGELQENARITASEIGRRVGLTAPAVAERISRMEEDGYIKGYRTVVDYDALGLAVKVFIQFKATASMKHGEMAKIIDALPQVREWYSVTGDCCMMLKVAVASTADLEDLIVELGEYGETVTSIILSGNPKNRIVTRDSC